MNMIFSPVAKSVEFKNRFAPSFSGPSDSSSMRKVSRPHRSSPETHGWAGYSCLEFSKMDESW